MHSCGDKVVVEFIVRFVAAVARQAMSALADFSDAIRRSLFPKSTADIRLVDEQLALARHASWSNVFVIPLASILLAMSNASVLPLWRVVGWPLALTAT